MSTPISDPTLIPVVPAELADRPALDRERAAELEGLFKVLASERNLKIRCDGLTFNEKITVDAEKINQVVRNLLSNAVKFSPSGQVISISSRHDQDMVLVSVHNFGPVIPEDELELVFHKFVQSSKTKTGAGGTGLGLAICREIIMAHKGRIWAHNADDGGVEFSFELPLYISHDTQPEVLLANKIGD